MIENSYKHIVANLSLNKLFYYTGYYFIAAVLFVSGVSKIIDPQPFLETLNLIKYLPEEVRIAIATALPMIELVLAVLIIGKIKVKITLLHTTVLFSAFFAFSLYGTIAGFNADCGCFGNTVKSEIGWGMVVRNFLFMIIATIVVSNVKRQT
ncbi:MAG: methylamine utilization protein [Ignavibacteriales bacterium]|nr:methylamine utilization protein [Ignavibacteriales bacterium]